MRPWTSSCPEGGVPAAFAALCLWESTRSSELNSSSAPSYRDEGIRHTTIRRRTCRSFGDQPGALEGSAHGPPSPIFLVIVMSQGQPCTRRSSCSQSLRHSTGDALRRRKTHRRMNMPAELRGQRCSTRKITARVARSWLAGALSGNGSTRTTGAVGLANANSSENPVIKSSLGHVTAGRSNWQHSKRSLLDLRSQELQEMRPSSTAGSPFPVSRGQSALPSRDPLPTC